MPKGGPEWLICHVAEAFYGGVPPGIATEVVARLDDRIRATMGRFADRFAG